jgi:hypothetical protein
VKTLPTTTTVNSWRKSSYSAGGSNGSNCVEAGTVAHGVAVRDTKHHGSGILTADHTEWTALLVAIKHGEFDC